MPSGIHGWQRSHRDQPVRQSIWNQLREMSKAFVVSVHHDLLGLGLVRAEIDGDIHTSTGKGYASGPPDPPADPRHQGDFSCQFIGHAFPWLRSLIWALSVQ